MADASDIIFDEAPHTYTLNGERLPGVTSCIDDLNDYSKVPPAVLDKARQRGQDVHLATELYDRGELDWSTITDEIHPYLEAWIQFRADSGFEPVAIERIVYNAKHRYTGMLDRTGYFHRLKGVKPTQLVVCDIKATAMMMPGTGPQTAAYLEAYNEGIPVKEKIKLRYGVQLAPKKNPPYQLVKYKKPGDWAVFLACLTVKRFKEEHNID